MSDQNKKELEAAFERLKAGKPIRTKKGRKITPTSVEDEAGLGRSILRNNAEYRALFDEIVTFKRDCKKVNSGKGAKLSSVDSEIKKLKLELQTSKNKVKALTEKYQMLLSRNAELTQIIIRKRYNEAFFKNMEADMSKFVSQFQENDKTYSK